MRLLLSVLLLTLSLYGGEGEKPKNIVLMIGDGMGTAAVSVNALSDSTSPFYRFPVTGFSVTTSYDALITESAAGATALATGQKTRLGYLGYSPDGLPLPSLLELAKAAGYATGIVVSSSITDATPAAFYAHISGRKNHDSVALFLMGRQVDLIIGGGAQFLLPSPAGKRKDSLFLADSLRAAGYTVTLDSAGFFGSPGQLPRIALLAQGGLPPAAERGYTLGTLCSLALHMLSATGKPVFLMVEGSQVDWAGHANDGPRLISEMVDFAGAISQSLNFAASNRKTLVVVTADHETGGAAVGKGNRDGSGIQLDFTTKGHTGVIVPVFAYGPAAIKFSGVRGNNEIGKILISLLNKKR